MTRLTWLAVLMLVLAACSNDDGAPVDPGGGGNQAVTVISMANKDAWTFSTSLDRGYTYWENGVYKCSVEIYGTPPYCSSLNRSESALSVNRIDFTQFKTCRVQFRVHARAHAYAWTGGAYAGVTVVIHSNVPATPDLEVVKAWAESDHSEADELDETFDLSLENALGFREGTVAVYLQTTLNEPSQSPCQSESVIEIHSFKILGTK